MNQAALCLEDGTYFKGVSFGASGEVVAEICFNTSMSGYQEILTDPSYAGQMVTMTYPEIGNYGVNLEDMENEKTWIKGFIVKNYSPIVSNFRASGSLDEFLKKQNVLGIQGIDTRKLVRHIRDKGAMRAIISTKDFDAASLQKKVLKAPTMEGQDLASIVSHPQVETFKAENRKFRVAAFDFGCKQNILKRLNHYGCEVVRVPAQTSFEEIQKLKVDGVFLSNGPGDPAAVGYVIPVIQKIMQTGTPMFGICLGHQLMALAYGAKTYKLKFGHRGGNQPVMDLTTGKVEITSQNHGFAVDESSLPSNVRVTHINLNDKTNEGLAHQSQPFFSVQYHPEASPGPHDSDYLFPRFVGLMERVRK